jgi:hypothetical protein
MIVVNANEAKRLATIPGNCAVAALVMSCAWSDHSEIEWIYRPEIDDWSAYLHTNSPLLKKEWLRLCLILQRFPEAGKNNSGVASRVIVDILEFISKDYTVQVI